MLESKKLVKETEWTRIYEIRPNQLYYESKFIHDNLDIRAADIRNRWDSLSNEERMDFVRAFQLKYPLTAEDEDILEFLMQVGNEDIWSTIALPLTRSGGTRRKEVLTFLRTRASDSRSAQANYFQAIALLDDKEAIPVLKEQLTRLRQKMPLDEKLSFEDLLVCIDYLSCCAALYKLERSPQYRQEIERLQTHADERIRNQARFSLTDTSML